jgi:hypothetical protein
MRAILMAVALTCCQVAAATDGAVIVNGTVLDARVRMALEQRYGTRLQQGRYWYDTMSGLWGMEGGPSVGQIIPGLRLGPLASDASVKSRWLRTFVFVNGREIHPRELSYLQNLFGPVGADRYWLDARGIAGYEGGPPQFDLRAKAIARGAGGGGYSRRGAFGSTGSDGQCSYYNDVNSGASVLTGDC